MQYNPINTRSKTLAHDMYVLLNGKAYKVGTLKGCLARDGKRYTKAAQEKELAKYDASLQWLNEMPVVLSANRQRVEDAVVVDTETVYSIKGLKGKFKIVFKWGYAKLVQVNV